MSPQAHIADPEANELETLQLSTGEGSELDAFLAQAAAAPAKAGLELFAGVGARLGHYELRARLGHGAMGIVFRAFDSKLEREVALKLVANAELDSPERLRKVAREAKTLASLNHPNLVSVYSIEAVGGLMFITMELIPGESLRDRLDRGPLPRAELLRAAQELATGLAAAHEAGIIHRDIKPANVRIREDGKFILVDFGLARHLGSREELGSASAGSNSSYSATSIAGTPAYMAPEQRVRREVDARVDVWALGLMLFEMGTGDRDYHRRRSWSLPSGLRRPVVRCLRRDPYLRYPSAVPLAKELQRPRRWPIAAAVLAGGFAATAVTWSRVDRARCEVPDSQFEGVWDRESRGRILGRLSASELGKDEVSSRTLERELDAYASGWRHERQAVCEAPRESIDPVERGRAERCLDAEFARFVALSSSLQRGDEGALRRGLEHLQSFPAPESCLIRARSREREGGMERDLQGPYLAVVEHMVMRSHELESQGDFDAALAVLDQADAQYDASQAPSQRAASQVRRASIFLRAERFADARVAASEAFDLGVSQGDEQLIARGLLSLAAVHREQGEFEQSASALRLVEPYLARLGPDVGLDYHRAQTELAVRERAWARGFEHLGRQISLTKQFYGPTHRRVGLLEAERGNIYTLSGANDDEALASYGRAREIFEKSYGPSDRRTVALLQNMAGVYQRHDDKVPLAQALTEKVLELTIAEHGEEHPFTADAMINLAVVLSAQGKWARSRELIVRGLEARRSRSGEQSPGVLTARMALAIANHGVGHTRQAVRDWSRLVPELSEVFGEGHAMTTYARTQLALRSMDIGELEAAERGLAELRAVVNGLDENDPLAADTVAAMGELQLGLGHFTEAAEASQSALTMYELSRGNDRSALAAVKADLAGALAALGEHERALELVLSALEGPRSVDPGVDAQLRLAVARSSLALGRRELARESCEVILDTEYVPVPLQIQAHMLLADELWTSQEAAEQHLRAVASLQARLDYELWEGR